MLLTLIIACLVLISLGIISVKISRRLKTAKAEEAASVGAFKEPIYVSSVSKLRQTLKPGQYFVTTKKSWLVGMILFHNCYRPGYYKVLSERQLGGYIVESLDSKVVDVEPFSNQLHVATAERVRELKLASVDHI